MSFTEEAAVRRSRGLAMDRFTASHKALTTVQAVPCERQGRANNDRRQHDQHESQHAAAQSMTDDTINKAIDIIQARIITIHAPSVVEFCGNDDREHTRGILENIVAENPVYKQ